tara:strand:- start:235 stop:510 length:276 start_codon:yes stop_codon:yes gene_type:complete
VEKWVRSAPDVRVVDGSFQGMRVAANHFNGTEKSSQMVFRTGDELTGQLFNVIVADFDRTFRAYLVGPDVTRTEGYFRAQTGAAHPIAGIA